MTPSIAYKILFIISVLMLITAVAEIAFALFTGEFFHVSYTMILLTMVNAALFFIVGLNIKSKAEKEENNR